MRIVLGKVLRTDGATRPLDDSARGRSNSSGSTVWRPWRKVRAYDARGRLEAAFGRFGEGPVRVPGIAGLAETSSGRFVVLDSG